MEGDVAQGLFTDLPVDAPLDAALLVKRTGVLVASWTRTAVLQDALPVMSATLFASVQTLLETFGDDAPESVWTKAGRRQILVQRAESNLLIVLVAKDASNATYLRRTARYIAGVASAIERAAAQPTKAAPRSRRGAGAGSTSK